MVGYHFGSKADLLDSVIARRIELLNSERIAFLQNALAERKGAPVPLRLLLEGYVGCMIFRASLPDAGWRNYAQLVAALANSSEWTELTARHFNEVAELYLREFQRSLPGTPPEDVYRGFFFAVGTMVAVCSRPGRIETLSKGKFKSEDVSRLRESLCDFLEGGFKALRRH